MITYERWGENMNKLNILLIIILVIIIIALTIVSFMYFDVRKTAKENLELYLNAEEKITLLIERCPELQNIDIESLGE